MQTREITNEQVREDNPLPLLDQVNKLRPQKFRVLLGRFVWATVQRGLEMTGGPGCCRKLNWNTTKFVLVQKKLGRVSEALHLR
jgi:hypothetical protein